MYYRSEREDVPRVAVSIAFADEDWYKTLSQRATPMIQLEEKALVAAGMSMLWVPRDPRAYPVYAHKGRGYSLMNVFDPKVAGGISVAALPGGEPGWISRIRDNFWHPSNESMAAYANVILGVVEDETNVDVVPTREELILLSSEESAGSSHDLIHHSSRAGPQQGPTQEPAGEGISTPPIVDPTVAAAKQKETRKKKREEKKTEGEKTAEVPANAPTRKRSSSINLLDYVVVSDSLSGLNAGVKRSAPDPDDDVTFTEMLAKKQKVLEDKKCELDAQAVVVLSEKKLKFMGEIVAPSESEVDLGFLERNLVIFLRRYSRHPPPLDDNCLSFTTASAKSTRYGVKVDISKITPPISPPPVPFDVSHPYPDPKGKGKEGNVENDVAEKVVQSVAPCVVVQEGGVHVEGAETDWESSEATPQGTIYTRRGPPTPGGGGPSGSRQGPEFRRVEGGGSWTDNNPTCDDLPHAPPPPPG
ncbi:hypothetical protein HanPI659440_Chr13g0506171 [Helianthus annuus]|nr:hypothetical protein HanPI659440_Chr13g0506171 [Helianthus annuus]